MIGGYMQARQPMLVTELGNQGLHLGRMWFERHGVVPDCKNRRLLWPDQPSLNDEVQISMTRLIPRKILKRPTADESHQRDADHRDRLMDGQDVRERETHRKIRQSYGASPQDSVNKINRALKNLPVRLLVPKKKEQKDPQQRKSMEIAAIGGVGFHRHIQREGTEVFVTSLAQIDRILEEIHDPERAFKANEIRTRIPKHYHDEVDVFSKIDSNTLPPL